MSMIGQFFRVVSSADYNFTPLPKQLRSCHYHRRFFFFFSFVADNQPIRNRTTLLEVYLINKNQLFSKY